MRPKSAAAMLAALLLLAQSASPATASAANCSQTSVGITPLNDLASGSYKGQQGGLYPGGADVRPSSQEVSGQLLADSIMARTSSGQPDRNGRYVLLSIGMSNATEEFSAFKPQADADPAKNPNLVIVDGAQGGVTANKWANPADPAWSTVDGRLASAGVSGKQVAAVWVKVADAGPTQGFPGYAQTLEGEMAQIAQNLHARFPNLLLAYYSSRIYAGYASSVLNPEPYAYESGFSVKWLIGAQLSGSASLNFDPARGAVKAPWLAWGPYLWADGLKPRSDGLTWSCSDFGSDGTHPSASGQQKVASKLLSFFKGDSTASLWFSPPRASSRSVTLHLRDHGRLAAGTVASRGFVGCRMKVPVIIERARQHGWSKVRRVRTRDSGRYRAALRARAGSYRARLPARSVGTATDRPCLAATSAAVRGARR